MRTSPGRTASAEKKPSIGFGSPGGLAARAEREGTPTDAKNRHSSTLILAAMMAMKEGARGYIIEGLVLKSLSSLRGP